MTVRRGWFGIYIDGCWTLLLDCIRKTGASLHASPTKHAQKSSNVKKLFTCKFAREFRQCVSEREFLSVAVSRSVQCGNNPELMQFRSFLFPGTSNSEAFHIRHIDETIYKTSKFTYHKTNSITNKITNILNPPSSSGERETVVLLRLYFSK